MELKKNGRKKQNELNKSDFIEFDHHVIRRGDLDGELVFSLSDVCLALTDSGDSRKYWNQHSRRLKKQGIQLEVHQLFLKAQDGKTRLIRCGNFETVMKLVQSISSPKTVPFKNWLAKMGNERIEETRDPSIAVSRALKTWKNQGFPPEWIAKCVQGQTIRNQLTDYWNCHGIQNPAHYAILTNVVHQGWSGITVAEHKKLKNFINPNRNLRNSMTQKELLFSALAELTTKTLAENKNAFGFQKNQTAAREGGEVAKYSRLLFEAKTGTQVISSKDESIPNERLFNKKISKYFVSQ